MSKKWLQSIAHRHARPGQTSRVRAFTLAEMLVSVGITSTLVLALGSILMVATHALPEADLLEGGLFTAHQAAEDLVDELQFAITFTERAPNAIAFTVADRGSDGSPELIRYAWAGTPGDPLMRQYNSDASVEVLADVNDFTLTYRTREEVIGQTASGTQESGEILLEEYTTPGALADYAIKDRNWVGQTIRPSLPADTTEWSVTRVRFCARYNQNTSGVTAVQIRPLVPSSLVPHNTVLAESPMYENTLSGVYVWQEFSFVDVSGISPDQDLCLVLARQVNDAILADIQYVSGAGSGLLVTSDSGSTWSYEGSTTLLYQVYGTVTADSVAVPTRVTRLHSVGLDLDLGTNSIETGIQILNAPEVTVP